MNILRNPYRIRMSCTFIFLIFLFSSQCFSQEIDSLQVDTHEDDVRLIRNHLYQNFRIPTQAMDSMIPQFRYTISIVIDEEGNVTNPTIESKTENCPSCEIEIMRVMKLAPKVQPFIENDQKVKHKWLIPFVIVIQD